MGPGGIGSICKHGCVVPYWTSPSVSGSTRPMRRFVLWFALHLAEYGIRVSEHLYRRFLSKMTLVRTSWVPKGRCVQCVLRDRVLHPSVSLYVKPHTSPPTKRGGMYDENWWNIMARSFVLFVLLLSEEAL